jgi:hypothetical protein
VILPLSIEIGSTMNISGPGLIEEPDTFPLLSSLMGVDKAVIKDLAEEMRHGFKVLQIFPDL